MHRNHKVPPAFLRVRQPKQTADLADSFRIARQTRPGIASTFFPERRLKRSVLAFGSGRGRCGCGNLPAGAPSLPVPSRRRCKVLAYSQEAHFKSLRFKSHSQGRSGIPQTAIESAGLLRPSERCAFDRVIPFSNTHCLISWWFDEGWAIA